VASEADIVVTSTGAPHHIFRREKTWRDVFAPAKEQAHVLHRYRRTPRRRSAVNELDGIFVYDIDDFSPLLLPMLPIASAKPRAPRRSSMLKSAVPERLDTLDVVPQSFHCKTM